MREGNDKQRGREFASLFPTNYDHLIVRLETFTPFVSPFALPTNILWLQARDFKTNLIEKFVDLYHDISFKSLKIKERIGIHTHRYIKLNWIKIKINEKEKLVFHFLILYLERSFAVFDCSTWNRITRYDLTRVQDTRWRGGGLEESSFHPSRLRSIVLPVQKGPTGRMGGGGMSRRVHCSASGSRERHRLSKIPRSHSPDTGVDRTSEGGGMLPLVLARLESSNWE